MPTEYETLILNLVRDKPFINAVLVIEGARKLVYSMGNNSIRKDIRKLLSSWVAKKTGSIFLSGKECMIRICTDDKLIITSLSGDGHIIGARDDERKIIVHIEPDGIIGLAYMEIAKILLLFRSDGSRLKDEKELKQSGEIQSRITSIEGTMVNEEIDDADNSIPFTARLMAYQRAQETKRECPLIVDPFAEPLAGDMTGYIRNHIRYSEMDYPIVRSYFIEERLLKPWCRTNNESQIVLLGAGLDTRAYRVEALKTNKHTIFEIDFSTIIGYKEEILSNEQPLCDLIRLSVDLSNPEWVALLINAGFSSELPTFWILEGLVYYLEREMVGALLKKAAQISREGSKIFVDIVFASRWIPFPNTVNDFVTNFSKHIKWGLDIKDAPDFFANSGWNVSVHFADDYDQGRNVGQKGMIFVHGERL